MHGKYVALLCVSIGIAGCAAQPSAIPTAVPTQAAITTDQWQTLLTELRAAPNARIRDEETETLIEIPRKRTVYIFTKAGHPAHPAYAKRELVETGGKREIIASGDYAGSYAEFVKWSNTLQALDQRLLQRVPRTKIDPGTEP